MKNYLRLFCLSLSCSLLLLKAYAQTLSTPKLVPDGAITKLEYSPEQGLIMAGDFRYVGYPAQNVAIVDNSAADPVGSFPSLTVTNNADKREVIPDGVGGWYVVANRETYGTGTFDKRPQHIWYDSTNRMRSFDCVTHILANNSLDTTFKINANTASYKIINVQSIVLYKSTIYAWCELADTQGYSYRRKLLGIDAKTGAIVWDPNTNHRSDRALGGMILIGHNLFMVGAINVVNGQPVSRSSLCYNLETRQTTNWDPLGTYDFSCTSCGPSGLSGYKNKVITKILVAGNRDYTNFTELIATDTLSSTTVWRRQMGPLYNLVGVALNDTVGYYHSYAFGPDPDTRKLNKLRLSDGQTTATFSYAQSSASTDTSTMFVGNINGLALQGKYLYLFGNVYDGGSIRRSAVQIDITNFSPTQWKPFNERTVDELDQLGNSRDIKALAFQGNKVFMLGDFKLIKLNYSPKLAAIDPIANTLRWRPRINLNTFSYNGNITNISADGDSLFWVTQGYGYPVFTAFDARTGFKIRSFTFTSLVEIKRVIAASDRLYLQGNFANLQGFPVNNGFGVISKTGAPFPWEPIFPINQGQVNKMVVQGDQIYLGGRFTANNGSQNLAIINRFTGVQTSWKAQMPNSRDGYEYEVKDFLVQGGELLTVRQDRGFNLPGEYRKVSLSTGKITADYSYTTCQAADQLLAKDKYVFINEKYCTPYTRENLSYFDQGFNKFSNTPLLPKYSIQVPGDAVRDYLPNPNDMTFVGNKLYLASSYGGSQGPYAVGPQPGLMTLDFPKGFFNEAVEYFPKSGGNAGTVTVNFYGYSLGVGSKVQLTRTGQSPITVPDSLITFPDPFRVQATFNLAGKTVGTWNIQIITSTGELISILNSFTINQAKEADIQIWLNAPSAFRAGRPIRLVLSMANRGDMDVYMAPAWIAVPNSTTVLGSFNTNIHNEIQNSDTVQLMKIDKIGGLPYDGLAAWLVIPLIKAGELIEIPITIITNSPISININTFSGQSLNSNSSISLKSGRTMSSVEKSLISPEASECFKKAGIPIIEELIAKELVNKYVPEESAKECQEDYLNTAFQLQNYKLHISETFDVVSGIAQTAWNCVGNPATVELPAINLAGNTLATLLGLIDKRDQIINGFKDCIPLLKPFLPDPKKQQPAKIEPVPIQRISSLDPNDKLGPFGIKSKRYISSKNPSNYLVRFENDTTATANAQLVRIIDTLDRNNFDYTTFQLGYFNVADTTFYIPPGRKQYSIDWDLRPTKKLVLRMQATFSDTTGILTSTYTALDPVTMELTQDVFAGFLPPNHNPPKGEGGLAYSIKAKDGLQNLTLLKNTAHIYFDNNAPIPTPTWTNTIDKGLPQSSMKPLATTSRSTTLTLGWHGTDAESGLKLYDVFVSVNGGGYQSLLTATYDSTFQFVGKADSTYRFYSVAYDGVYNQELTPLTFDTETTIRLNTAAIESLRSGNWNDIATWSCGCIPTASDNVIVKLSHTVLLDSTMQEAACQNLEIIGSFSMQGSALTVNGVRIEIDSGNVITK